MSWWKYVGSKLNNAYVIKGKFRKCLLEEVGLETMLGINNSQPRGEWHYRHMISWPRRVLYRILFIFGMELVSEDA